MSIRKNLEKGARIVNKVTGATNLAKYLGEGMAKRKNPAVQRTVTGKQALVSAAKAASFVVPGGVYLKAAKMARTAKAAKAAAAKNSPHGYFKLPGQKKPVRYNKEIGANPSSLRHLKGDKKIK